MRRLRLVVWRTRASQAIWCQGNDKGKGFRTVHQRDDRFRTERRQLFGQQEDRGEFMSLKTG